MAHQRQTPELKTVSVPIDGRQSQRAANIQRGVVRLLSSHGLASVCELVLANGRRADVTGLSGSGEIWMVEIKSSLEDFRADTKWPEYQDYCDRFFFAVAPDFPIEVLPEEAGLIFADKFGGEVVRNAPEDKLAGGRRKAMMILFARSAAHRLSRVMDPDLKTQLEIDALTRNADGENAAD